MTYVRNPLVNWLLFHAYGQGGTVAVPADDPAEGAIVPRGEFPPGIGETLAHLAERSLAGGTGNEIDWCFLVGGPGNGKSEALRDLAGRLHVALPQRTRGMPVPRVIPVAWPGEAASLPGGRWIAFVNDASIPRPLPAGATDAPGSLYLDILDTVKRTVEGKPTSLFVNVNRGILVEERNGVEQLDAGTASPAEKLSASIINWLSAPPRETSASHPGIENVVCPAATTPYYGQFRVDLAPVGCSLLVVVHVVFLDVLSLLEPRPGSGGAAIDFSAEPPEVAPYRTLGKLVSTAATRDSGIAGGLLRIITGPAGWQDGHCKHPDTGELCQAHARCPLAQNAAWLQDSALRHRFLDTLRAVEVAAGRRLTYRDLLGHFSLALIGHPRESWLSGSHPCSWVEQQDQAIASRTKESTRAIVNLAATRVYSNLFPGCGFAAERKVKRHELKTESAFTAILPLLFPGGETARPRPLERASSDIDPARDTGRWNGLRKKVLDAAEAIVVAQPSAQLAGWSELSPASVSEIERLLDRVVQDEIRSEFSAGSSAAAARVRAVRRWRSATLLRQVGLATGHVRFAPALDAWLAEQENALDNGSRLKLGDGLNNLILAAGGTGKVYLAPLRPRTYCLSGELPRNTLLVAVNVSDLDVRIVAHGDTLIAEVQARDRQCPRTLAFLAIDLAVAREAILHAVRKENSFTEIGDAAYARIERARASLVSRERLLQLQASYTDDSSAVLNLSSNPAGTPPLRVISAGGNP